MINKIHDKEWKPLSEQEEMFLRQMLWLSHGCPFPALYGDDGEMQCNSCMIDFKRMEPSEILSIRKKRAVENLQKMGMIKKMMITRYDDKITEPPYLTIQIDEMLVEEPEHDNLGEEFALRIRQGCMGQGYKFKFYTTSSNPEFDYEVVVE